MKIRRFAVVALSVGLAAGLALTSCSGGKKETPSAGGSAELGTTNDINPKDVSALQQGGNLRLALTAFPENFNPLHIDGNSADSAGMLKASLPRAFRVAADGSMTLNTDYFTGAELTSSNPQVVTWTISPKAVWSDGTPITWEDIASQIHATSGQDKAFAAASPNGADRVASVTRGVDDRQAIMKFAKPYAEWRGMLSGNTMLLPKSMTATPEAFNKGQLSGPGPSAGPFIVSTLDRTAQRIVLTRNPRWWGAPGLLDSVTYLVLDDAARHRFDSVGPVGARARESLVLAAGGVELGGDVLPRDRGAVAPNRLRIDGPGDHLGVGARQFGPGEIVGVQRHRPVGGDPERPRHAGLEHACGIGGVAVDMQRVEVLRKRGQRQPQVAALLQLGYVLRVDVVRRPDLRGPACRRRFLLAAGAGGEGETGDKGCHGEASDLHGDRRYLRFGSG
ncbi:MAG: glutathione transport system substrate-binding protein [Mycobacterium sp.]|nr:glutathione transport system substrate-binding protein [Mycobacterium sp.]